MSMGTGGATLMMVTVPMVHGFASVMRRGLATKKVGNVFEISDTFVIRFYHTRV